jgi:RNA polymerase sigma-70 factor (ECF subfamily)
MDQQLVELQQKLKRFIRRFLKQPEDVEDIAQESFIRVLEAGSQGKIDYPKAYLYRTARNLAFNKLTSSAHQLVDAIEDLPDADVLASTTTLEDEIGAQRRFELFCRAVAQLPEQCRTVLILRKVYGLSQREVADQLGIAVSTVEKHLAKGLLRCADYMNRHEQAPAAASVPPKRFRQQS